jgi:hypothetical protein
MDDALSWDGNWAWALPLIVLTLILHVVGLVLINTRMQRLFAVIEDHRSFSFMFGLVMGVTMLLVTLLHAFEATIWGAAYVVLGALPDGRTAMLYSLSAITTYGHTDLTLAPHWRLMGALEALNGVPLFGLTTAFLYGYVQRFWQPDADAAPRPTPRERVPPGERVPTP